MLTRLEGASIGASLPLAACRCVGQFAVCSARASGRCCPAIRYPEGIDAGLDESRRHRRNLGNQLCLLLLTNRLLKLTKIANGEGEVRLYSIIVHETETGCAQCFREDVANPHMGLIALDDIEFSPAIRSDWPDPELFDKLKRGERFANPTRV